MFYMLSFALANTPEHSSSDLLILPPVELQTSTAELPSEPEPQLNSSEESTPSDFKLGYSHGWSKAKEDEELKQYIKRNASIRGAIYGGLDGYVFVASYGFLGIFSASAHIIANNIYIYSPIDLPPLAENEITTMSEEVQRGYKRGFKTYVRLYKRGLIVSTGLAGFTTSSIIMLNSISGQ